MESMKPEIFDIEIGGRTYTIEFNRKAIKEADEAGIKGMESTINLLEIIFYVGLKKHKPDVTPNLAKKILETAIGSGEEEGEYAISDFSPVIDEFTRWYQLVFGAEGRKKITSRKDQMD